jgi:hypothetical protein
MVNQLRNLAFGVNPSTSYDCRHAVITPASAWTPQEQQNCKQLTTRATISTDSYAPVLYTVPAGQPRVPVILGNNNPSLKRAFTEGVPIPDGARPANGTDNQLIIWQPATDTMWEFWLAQEKADGWHANYGGRIRNVSQSPGYYRDILDPATTLGRGSDLRYFEQHTWGGPASSIPNLPGLITVDQLRSGVIGHALDFATWTNAPGKWVYPAQRTDGRCRGSLGQYCSQIPQGARFRLDPSYDTSQLKNPIVRMMAKAVQDYGMVLNNTTGAGVAFSAEGWQQHGWQDPYSGPNGLFGGTTSASSQYPTVFMREFPWEHLEMLQRGTTCTVRQTACLPGA